MKKFLLVTLFFLLGSTLYADFKVLGGLNLSKYSGDEEISWTYKMGFQAGLGIELDITYRTLFEVNILFFSKGSRTRSSVDRERFILNTVSIPLLLRSKLFHGTSPYAVGGVEIARTISNKVLRKDEEAVDLEGTLKSIDFSGVFGAGFELELEEKLYLFIEARYHLGQRNLLVLSDDGLTRKTTAFVLLIGIRS